MSWETGTAPKVCAVCGVVLDRMGATSVPEPDDEWFHTQELVGFGDHVAVPVDYGDVPVNTNCDFCHDRVPAGQVWTVPAESFEMPDGAGHSVGNWAACEPCATLVRRKRWTQLVNRATDGYFKHTPDPNPPAATVIRPRIRRSYERLQRHVTGDPRPWRAGDEKRT